MPEQLVYLLYGYFTVMFVLILIVSVVVLKCIGSKKIFRFILDTIIVVGVVCGVVCGVIFILIPLGHLIFTIKEFLWNL